MNAANARLVAAIATELWRARDEIEALGCRLAMDPAIVARHAADLQAFDRLAQVHGELARLMTIVADGEDAAPDTIGLEALGERLR